MKRILVIGDPHAHPRYDNDRFYELGKYARVRRVDHIHCVGDWTDFPSLNEHKSKKEQRPYLVQDDVDAGNDALARFDEGLGNHPCEKTITLGNHDAYPSRWVAENPKFEGVITNDMVNFKKHKWKCTPFREARKVRGLWCAHYFTSGATGRPQGGTHVAYQNSIKQGMSCIVGHNHRLNISVRTRGDGSKVHSFSA